MKITLLTLCAMSLSRALAGAEPVNIPAFTALSEPKIDGVEVRENDGVYKWTDKTQSLVWYGDLRDVGALQIALKFTLPAGQTAHWRLSLTGQNPVAALRCNGVLTS